jgi:hypothetical protein
VVEFTSAHPEIVSWLNLHCYGGVFIRPLGHAADTKMDQGDLAVFRQLEVWAKELTGYPVVSGYEEFLYAPDKPLHGDLTDYAYNQRGAFAFVVELWDLFKRLEMPAPKKFVDYYGHFDRAAAGKLAAWDRAHNQGRVVQPWRPFDHPQLGRVELGGIDARIGIWNPPPELLGEVCAQQAACFLRVAALAPEVVVRSATATQLGDELARIDLVVDNRGYLATYGVGAAKPLEWNEPLYAELTTDDCALVEPTRARAALGHLAGWGRGVGVGADELAYLRSNGNGASARASWLVQGLRVARRGSASRHDRRVSRRPRRRAWIVGRCARAGPGVPRARRDRGGDRDGADDQADRAADDQRRGRADGDAGGVVRRGRGRPGARRRRGRRPDLRRPAVGPDLRRVRAHGPDRRHGR